MTEKSQAYGTVRTSLIVYGVAAYTYFQVGSWSGTASRALGNWGSAHGFALLGLTLQLLLILARALLKRYVSDLTSVARIMMVLEIVADGVTVMLFAMATLGPLTQAANAL